MTRRKTYYPCDRKRLARVERKCDAILSLLDAREEDKEIDRTISLLHIQARRMKDQALIQDNGLLRYREKGIPLLQD